MTPLDALKVGLIQCLAMIPGTSHLGGDHHWRHVPQAVAQGGDGLSFFLAIPTLIGAGVYSLYKERALLAAADTPVFAVGLLFSSCRPGSACAGCCATWPRTPSRPLPGTASPLAWWSGHGLDGCGALG